LDDLDTGEGVALETVRDELLQQLYDNRKELKGIALVQGLKAIASLVGLDDGEAVGEVSYTLVELLEDVNLPAERKRELLSAERDHHLAQLALIEEALEKE
jgi:hypothetical protein